MKIRAKRKIGITEIERRKLSETWAAEGRAGEIIYSCDGTYGIIIVNPKTPEEAVYGWENVGGYRIQHYRIEGLDMRATLAEADSNVPAYSYMVEGVTPCDDADRYRKLSPEEEEDTGRWRAKMAAAALGRITSPAKASAARENGKKGGRPRKVPGALPCECGAQPVEKDGYVYCPVCGPRGWVVKVP